MKKSGDSPPRSRGRSDPKGLWLGAWDSPHFFTVSRRPVLTLQSQLPTPAGSTTYPAKCSVLLDSARYPRIGQSGPAPMRLTFSVELLKPAHFCSKLPSGEAVSAGPITAARSLFALRGKVSLPCGFAGRVVPKVSTRRNEHPENTNLPDKKYCKTNPIRPLLATRARENKANQTHFFGFRYGAGGHGGTHRFRDV